MKRSILALLVLVGGGCSDSASDDQGGGSTAAEDTPAGSTSEAMPDVGVASSGGGAGQPNGGSCSVDGDCESGHCYLGMFGSTCGECTLDEHCPAWGCNPAVPTDTISEFLPSVCSDGSAGSGCETDAACQPELVCGPANVSLGGDSVERGTCGECAVDADCAGVCNPQSDFANNQTVNVCVAIDSVADGVTCNWAGSGDDACIGFCVETAIMGLVPVGVCSSCRTDDDCDNGDICRPPSVDVTAMEPVVAGECVAG